jgi:DNA-binding HxlR family transcriptional regulator
MTLANTVPFPRQVKTVGCPVDLCVAAIGGRWKPTIIYHLNQGAARFNVLRRLIPAVSARILTLQLRELEADGLISRTVHSQVPARVDYALTAEGASLMPILTAMAEWGLQRPGQAAAA